MTGELMYVLPLPGTPTAYFQATVPCSPEVSALVWPLLKLSACHLGQPGA
jgi:hypothetical protein